MHYLLKLSTVVCTCQYHNGAAKRARKTNWSESEVDKLWNSYLTFCSMVDGQLGISLTNADKDRAWKAMQER